MSPLPIRDWMCNWDHHHNSEPLDTRDMFLNTYISLLGGHNIDLFFFCLEMDYQGWAKRKNNSKLLNHSGMLYAVDDVAENDDMLDTREDASMVMMDLALGVEYLTKSWLQWLYWEIVGIVVVRFHFIPVHRRKRNVVHKAHRSLRMMHRFHHHLMTRWK